MGKQKWQKIILFFTSSLVSSLLLSQSNESVSICSYSENESGSQLCKSIRFNSFSSNIQAENAIDKLLIPIGLKRNFILVLCPQIKNCAAVTLKEDGGRYIIYDNEFLESIQTLSNSRWSSLSILAHEIGHHLDGHTLKHSSKYLQRKEELEADEFSGFILYKIGANLKDAQAAINIIQHPECLNEQNYDHPCKEKRLQAIREGWEKARALDSNPNQPSVMNNMNTNNGAETLIRENLNNSAKIIDLYKYSYNAGIRTFNEHDWSNSAQYFVDAVKYFDVIIQNKWTRVKTAFDTISILYAAYAFQNAKKEDDALKYYSRLANYKVADNKYIDIYKFILVNRTINNDATQFYYFLSIAKSLFPKEPWDEFKMDFINKNATLISKLETYNQDDSKGKLSSIEYMFYGDIFSNASRENNVPNIDNIPYRDLAIDAFKKGFSKNPESVTAAFNIGILHYNKYSEDIDKGLIKKAIDNADIALEWLNRTIEIVNKKSEKTSTETQILNRSRILLDDLNAFRKNRRK